jgi:uncharacterized protein YbjT (DUF2867 family)
MTGAPDHHDAPTESHGAAHEPVQYPVNHVLAVVDRREQMDAAVAALRSQGYLESEVDVQTGAERADDIAASTGRTGLADKLIRFAERIGVVDEEMETKNRFEQALRDNRFVIAVSTPTDERKEVATAILREHGGHGVVYFGKHTIEYITPPK